MNTTGKHNRLRLFFMAAAIVLVLVCVLPVCFIVSQTMQKKVPESINKAGSSNQAEKSRYRYYTVCRISGYKCRRNKESRVFPDTSFQ